MKLFFDNGDETLHHQIAKLSDFTFLHISLIGQRNPTFD